MSQSITAISAQKSCLYDIYQRHNNKIQRNNCNQFSFYEKLQGVTYTPDNKITYPVDNKGSKAGFLKHLLAKITDCLPRREPRYNVLESSPSPEFYYKKCYPHEASQSSLQSASTTIADLTDSISLGKTTTNDIEIISIKNAVSHPSVISPEGYIHQSRRNIYYATVPNDIYSPAGIKIYKELADFCQSDLQKVVSNARNADIDIRHELLGEIINKIKKYKSHQTALKKVNINKKNLSPDEHAEEITIQRKLTILYCAAESIIKKNSASFFYMIAMGDNKNYSDDLLTKKENKIMDYFSKYDARK